jgi:hypothetical protein
MRNRGSMPRAWSERKRTREVRTDAEQTTVESASHFDFHRDFSTIIRFSGSTSSSICSNYIDTYLVGSPVPPVDDAARYTSSKQIVVGVRCSVSLSFAPSRPRYASSRSSCMLILLLRVLACIRFLVLRSVAPIFATGSPAPWHGIFFHERQNSLQSAAADQLRMCA